MTDDPRFQGPVWKAFVTASDRVHEMRVAMATAEAEMEELREAAVAEVLAYHEIKEQP